MIQLIHDHKYYAEEAPNIDEVVRRANAEIQMENRNLQVLNLQLHEKHHTSSLKVLISVLCISNFPIFILLIVY